MKHPRLSKEYVWCYRYTGDTDEFVISDTGYDRNTRLRHRWMAFTVPVTSTQCVFYTSSLKDAVRILDNRERKQDNRKPRLNHERFGRGDGELALRTWECETLKRVEFSYWLYSLYEPTEEKA